MNGQRLPKYQQPGKVVVPGTVVVTGEVVVDCTEVGQL
jgi:cation transport ATPase